MSDDAENQPTFESLLDREFRWPRAGDRPFTQSEKWHDNAYIEPHGHGRMVMMMTGYKRAADLMVERSVTDDVDRASLVYPIIFNYRQFIELSFSRVESLGVNSISLQRRQHTRTTVQRHLALG